MITEVTIYRSKEGIIVWITIIMIAWSTFILGYVFSGLLGSSAREELESQNAHLRKEVSTLRAEIEIMQKELNFREKIIREKSAV